MSQPNDVVRARRGDDRHRMARFNGTSLITKLQMAMGVLLVLIVSYVALTFRHQSQLNTQMREQIDARLSNRDEAEDLKIQLLMAHVTMLDFLASGRTAELSRSHAALDIARKELDHLRTQNVGPSLGRSLNGLSLEIEQYDAEARRLRSYALPSPGLDQRQVADVADALRKRIHSLEDLSDAVDHGFQARLDGTRARFRRILLDQPRKTALAGAVVSLMLVLVLARQMWLLRSLRWLLYGVKLIEKGDFDVQIPTRSRDEVGQLTKSFNKMVRKVRARRERLLRDNITDALTGLFNQRQFRPLLHDEFERAVRQNLTFSLLMIDVDHFKSVNDTHGHEAGNAVLRSVAQALSDNLREIDVLIRYGGDEFAAILPGAEANEGRELAARLGRLSGAVLLPNGNVTHVTLSIGGATFPAHADSVDNLVRQADDALYLAKDAGRARAHWAGAPVARLSL